MVVSFAVAAGSLLVVRPAPSYDPWMWLLWGGELVAGELSTIDGPAFKPLPVAVAAVLAPLGTAAPWLWVLVARSAAVLAVVLAFRLGRRLADGSVLAGVLAATGVALCGQYLDLAATGLAEGLLLALALAGVEAWRSGHWGWALACGFGAGLVRVETWPFLLVLAVLAWPRLPRRRGALLGVALLGAALLVPVAWVLPEWVGSGDALRSVARAQVPNPGQPALADLPALASLHVAAALPLWPLWLGVALTVRPAWARGDRQAGAVMVPAVVGLAWIGLVAAMATVGFSGEPRYAVPGAALVAVSGAAGLVVAGRRPRWRRAGAGVAVALVAVAAVPRADDLVRLREAQDYQWGLQSDLSRLVAELGGPAAVLACGQPYVGPWRGPLMAQRLGVPKHAVEPDQPPEAPGVIFRSSLTDGAPPAPFVPGHFRLAARVGTWQAWLVC